MKNKLIFSDFTLEGDKLIGGVSYSHNVNSEEMFTVGTTASAEISFTTLLQVSVGDTFTYYNLQADKTTFTKIGMFVITDVTKDTHGRFKVKAYDFVSKFDVIVDEWIEKQTFPMTLSELFASLCSYVGVVAGSLTFPNATMVIQDNFTTTDTSGRTILSYIAQAAGGYAVAKSDGLIYITGYTPKEVSLDNTRYKTFWSADYNAPQITKVWVGMEQDDVGVSVGTDGPVLRIENNPLFYAEKPEEIEEYVGNVLAAVTDYNYVPVTLELFEDFGINCGDIISVNGITTMIMEKSWSNSGISLSSFGNPTRDISTTNPEIVALRGKYNKLTRTIEETRSELGDAQGNISVLQQTSTKIESELQGKITTYEQAEAPEKPVAGDLWYYTGETTEHLTYGKWYRYNGRSWGEIADSDIDTNAKAINKISQTLDGVVFDNGFGTTVINGSNITTGTISGARIDLNGTVDWSDLSEECQQTIETKVVPSSYGDEEVKQLLNTVYNIDHTTLDGTKIQSPTILSPQIFTAELYANSEGDGYAKMTGDGLNIYTKAGKAPKIGLGYHTNVYDYPYLILGTGVDSAQTNAGMVKKFATGIWIGDNDAQSSTSVGGTGIFINFSRDTIYKYIDGVASEIGEAVFG